MIQKAVLDPLQECFDSIIESHLFRLPDSGMFTLVPDQLVKESPRYHPWHKGGSDAVEGTLTADI
jgi:hypothetical protein